MIIYVENSRVSTQKLLELINDSSEVAEYKFNIQKTLVFLKPIIKYQKEKVKNKNPFKKKKDKALCIVENQSTSSKFEKP